MELIIFFLKAWSILWTINILGWLWAVRHKTPSETLTLTFNLKTTFEGAIYFTSIYSWFI